MAGNPAIMEKLSTFLQDNLKKFLTVGATHWQKITSTDDVITNVQDSRFEFFSHPDMLKRDQVNGAQKNLTKLPTSF